jgi:hypothetical protein
VPHLVQTRPVTTLEAAAAPSATEAVPVVARGLAASPGRAAGVVRNLASPAEAGELEPGEILVTASTSPDGVPIMRRAAAILTDDREWRIDGASAAQARRTPLRPTLSPLTRRPPGFPSRSRRRRRTATPATRAPHSARATPAPPGNAPLAARRGRLWRIYRRGGGQCSTVNCRDGPTVEDRPSPRHGHRTPPHSTAPVTRRPVAPPPHRPRAPTAARAVCPPRRPPRSQRPHVVVITSKCRPTCPTTKRSSSIARDEK